MTENEVTIDGVRYVARKAVTLCSGCAGNGNKYLCRKLPGCSSIVWKVATSATDELTALRELNQELVESGQACVSAWSSVCDSHGWERDHLVQFPELSALIAKARGKA